jgi:hypothetical protein
MHTKKTIPIPRNLYTLTDVVEIPDLDSQATPTELYAVQCQLLLLPYTYVLVVSVVIII